MKSNCIYWNSHENEHCFSQTPTTTPPLSLQGSLLILLPSLQSTLSPFPFFTPVSSFSAIPRENDSLMHENGKEFSRCSKDKPKEFMYVGILHEVFGRDCCTIYFWEKKRYTCKMFLNIHILLWSCFHFSLIFLETQQNYIVKITTHNVTLKVQLTPLSKTESWSRAATPPIIRSSLKWMNTGITM